MTQILEPPTTLEGVLDTVPEVYPPLSQPDALLEANRCLYCADAPCMQACPTHIDIPGFIKKIASGNTTGAAARIFLANPVGATCARVCPTAELCEGACVLNQVDRPIAIGRLQRFATDDVLPDHEWSPHSTTSTYPATVFDPPAAPTGKKVAIVGSGPAGLSAAAYLVQDGHDVTVFDAAPMPGGLSTYGIIPQREPTSVSLREVKLIADLGVKIETNHPVDTAEKLDDLAERYDAVVLAIGLGAVPALDIPGGEHIVDGLEYIRAAKTNKQAFTPAEHVAVIGSGNTAIDVASVARATGADATIVYRRTPADMSAFDAEYHYAVGEGVHFRFLAVPSKVVTDDSGNVIGLEVTTQKAGPAGPDGRSTLIPSDEPPQIIPCDMVVRAIGQEKLGGQLVGENATIRGYIATAEDFRVHGYTNVYAAGDAIRHVGDASTVMAAQDGKLVAQAITAALSSEA